MKQLVDSFSPLPQKRPYKPLDAQYGTQWLIKAQTPQYRSEPRHTAPATQARPTTDKIRFASQPPMAQKSRKPTVTNEQLIPYAKLIRPHTIPRNLLRQTSNTWPTLDKPSKLRSYQQVPAQASSTKKRRLASLIVKTLLIPLAIIAAVIIGMFMQTLVFGEVAVCLYAIFALVLRISSRTTFQLAFITLIGILLLSATGKNDVLANNFAVYTFLLIVIGTLSLIRENYRTISV